MSVKPLNLNVSRRDRVSLLLDSYQTVIKDIGFRQNRKNIVLYIYNLR